jgi:RHS repeat-associated protein
LEWDTAKRQLSDVPALGRARSGGITVTKRNYTGQYRDDTGLLYYHARYYDPVLERFISPDTPAPSAGPLTASSCLLIPDAPSCGMSPDTLLLNPLAG